MHPTNARIFLNRLFNDAPIRTETRPRKSVRKPVSPMLQQMAALVGTAAKPVRPPSVERVCELLSQHMLQGVCIAEFSAAGGDTALHVLHENAAFRQLGGLDALAGQRTRSQFAAHLSERIAAAEGKMCIVTASSGVVFQVTPCAADTRTRIVTDARMRVVIVCEPARRNTKERELLSTVAHEMRNGMAALCGAVEVLGACAAADPSASRALAIARRQLDDMRRFVDDLLSVGQDTKREFEMTRVPTRVRDLLAEIVETHGGEAERRGIHLHVEPVLGETMVLGDAVRLRQVLSNLLLNACKFTPAGGCITLGVAVDDKQVQISVADTGSGIEPAQIAAIFEPFGQERYAEDQSGKGLGIGLCVARQLVQLHGGCLTAKSEGRNRGSEFVVTLPAA